MPAKHPDRKAHARGPRRTRMKMIFRTTTLFENSSFAPRILCNVGIVKGQIKFSRQNILPNIRLLFLATVCFYTVCSHADAASALSPDKAHPHLARILNEITPSGWRMTPAKRFNPENLWQQINGYAEFFLSYDMKDMTLAVYSDLSNEETVIEASIYDMGNPANAFGVFSAERQKEHSPLDLGREGYRSEASLFVWKGQYYIRMIASQDDLRVRRINLMLTQKLIHSLIDTGEPVWGLEILPKANRVPGSVRFFRRDAMGLDFLANTYTAQYRKDGALFTVFLSKTKDMATSEKILNRYIAYARQFGEGVQTVTREEVLFTLCDMGGSYDVLFQNNGLIAGITSVKNRDMALDCAAEFQRGLTSTLP